MYNQCIYLPSNLYVQSLQSILHKSAQRLCQVFLTPSTAQIVYCIFTNLVGTKAKEEIKQSEMPDFLHINVQCRLYLPTFLIYLYSHYRVSCMSCIETAHKVHEPSRQVYTKYYPHINWQAVHFPCEQCSSEGHYSMYNVALLTQYCPQLAAQSETMQNLMKRSQCLD